MFHACTARRAGKIAWWLLKETLINPKIPSVHPTGISFGHEPQIVAISCNIINTLEIAAALRSSQ